MVGHKGKVRHNINTNAVANQRHHAGPSEKPTPQVADPETCLVLAFPDVVLFFFIILLITI
jgi:hypothetical protein